MRVANRAGVHGFPITAPTSSPMSIGHWCHKRSCSAPLPPSSSNIPAGFHPIIVARLCFVAPAFDNARVAARWCSFQKERRNYMNVGGKYINRLSGALSAARFPKRAATSADSFRLSPGKSAREAAFNVPRYSDTLFIARRPSGILSRRDTILRRACRFISPSRLRA